MARQYVAPMFPSGTRVRHKRHGYIGTIMYAPPMGGKTYSVRWDRAREYQSYSTVKEADLEKSKQ